MNKMKWVSILVSIFIVFIWAFSWFLIDWLLPVTSRGAFGDKFGAINALFSGLALAGIVIAIFLQRMDINLQRKELRRTADAQEQSARALAENHRPYVTAYLPTIDRHIHVSIQNVGDRPARDVRVKFTPSLDGIDCRNVLGILSQSYIPPKKEVLATLMSLVDFHSKTESLPKRFEIDIRYFGDNEERFQDTYVVDLAEILFPKTNVKISVERGLQDIASAIKK